MTIINKIKIQLEKIKNRHDIFFQAWSEQNDEKVCEILQNKEKEFFSIENHANVQKILISCVPIYLDKTFDFIISKENFRNHMTLEELDTLKQVLSANVPNSPSFVHQSIIKDKLVKIEKYTHIIASFTKACPSIFKYEDIKTMVLSYTPVFAIFPILNQSFESLNIIEKVNLFHTIHNLQIPTTTDSKYNIERLKENLNINNNFNMSYQAHVCEFIRVNNLLKAQEFLSVNAEVDAPLLSLLMTDLILDTLAYRKMQNMFNDNSKTEEPITLLKEILDIDIIDINDLKIIRNTSASASHPQLVEMWDDLIRPLAEKSLNKKPHF